MQRISITPRADWQAKVESLGFSWHTPGGQTYWDESAYWAISPAERKILLDAAENASTMLLDTVEQVVNGDQLPLFGYTGPLAELIEQSWAARASEPGLTGRFDFAFDGVQPRLLDYNGEPLGIVETAVVQKAWAQEVFPGADQFAALNDGLAFALQQVGKQVVGAPHYDGEPIPLLHIAAYDSPEHEGTAQYLSNLATQMGVPNKLLSLSQIGWHSDGYFCDLENEAIGTLLKTCPLSWLLADEFGQKLAAEALDGNIDLLEPVWKMLAQNKRMLAALWDRYTYHPMLLQTSTIAGAGAYVRKPFNGSDGQNIQITNADGSVYYETNGNYEGEVNAGQVVYQERTNATDVTGTEENFVTFSVWVSNGHAQALSISESAVPVTDPSCRFVPHIVA